MMIRSSIAKEVRKAWSASAPLTATALLMFAALIASVAGIFLDHRGTTSHFNVATPLDAVPFGIMGTAIAVLWLASVGVLIALGRQKFSNTAWGWWLRLGMLVTVF